MPPERLALVGTGLIGASVGLAAKRAGVSQVAGWDADAASLAVAVERGAVDSPAESVARAVDDADLALVATPVATLQETVRAVLAAGSQATVSDVGSTKNGLCGSVSERERFIGGHPVCGSEARGPEYASAELFEGATWFLTPVAETEPERYKLLHGFVASLGAIPVAIDPAAHDRLMAVTSHLPHALANLILNHAGSVRVNGHEPLATAGGSLRDMTRVAGANPRIWIDIFLDNAEELRSSLTEHRRRVEDLERALEAGDAGWLARWIGEAAGNRRTLLDEAYHDVGRTPARPRARARPARSSLRHHAGARRRADQHRGLRAPAHVARAGRHPLRTGVRRGRGPAGGCLARGAGIFRHRVAGLRGRVGAVEVGPAVLLRGDLAVPGDKSISHRALLFAAVADGESRFTGFGASADTLSTAGAMRALGAEVEVEGDEARVGGVGLRGLRGSGRADRLRERRDADAAPARAARRPGRAASSSSGTSHSRAARWGGSPSRSRRWAPTSETEDGHAPLVIEGGAPLRAIRYELPVASAQVKSCVLLAGLFAEVGGRRRRAASEPRSHGADAGGGRGAGAEKVGGVGGVAGGASATARARDPGRLFIRGAIRRRGDAASRIDDQDPRRRHQSDAHRPARRARADGGEGRALQSADGGRRAGRRSRDRARRPGRDRDRAGRGAAARRRAAALRAGGRNGQRGERRAGRGRSCASRSRIASRL